MAARAEAGRGGTGVPQGQSADEESADEESADEKMGPALPASHGPRTWDGGQVRCEGRPDTRWSGQAPSREPRGRSRFRPADCIRTEEITLDTVNPIQGGLILLYVALVPSLLSQIFYMRGVELIGPGRAGLFVTSCRSSGRCSPCCCSAN